MGRRQLRVNEALKEVISQVVAGGLGDPRLGFVTVTGVRTTPDLRHARVYVSVLGSSAQHESSLEALRAAHGFIQAHLADELRLKRTPQLEFIYDETTDTAMRISGLLDEYLREHPVPPPDPNAAEAVDGEEAGGTAGAADETDDRPKDGSV
jgi:ribosome-binding factor A